MDSRLPLYNETFYTKEEITDDLQRQLDPFAVHRVLSAYEMAMNVHEYQLRNDATPYFWHLSRVARIIVKELQYYSSDVIAAALLHDALEDSHILTADVISYNLGPHVCHIVETLTKDLSLTGEARRKEEERYIQALRESDLDCKIVKFAERLDNYRCIEFGVKRNPFQYIEETEKLYYPIGEETNDPHLLHLVRAMKFIQRKLVA